MNLSKRFIDLLMTDGLSAKSQKASVTSLDPIRTFQAVPPKPLPQITPSEGMEHISNAMDCCGPSAPAIS